MADIGSGIAEYPALIITFIVGATVLVLAYISSLLNSSKSENDNKNTKEEMKKEKHADVSSQNNSHKPSKKKQSEKMFKDSKQNFTHPWLLTSLKGHSGRVLDMDFSANGKFLATCAEDRAVVIWSTKDWNEKQHKSMRVNIEFDHARFVKWSPDSKAFLIQKAAENRVEVYKVTRKPDGWVSGVTKAMTFPKQHNEETVALGIACNGKFIMSCSEKTDMLIWNLKGKELAKLDTYLMSTFCARITPCGRFVVASGFTPDVKIWEVVYTKTGDFHQVTRAFELSGHSSGIYDIGFNVDSTRMATVSKDGTWKVFDTKIEYAKGEDPHLLISGKYQNKGGPAHLAMSPDGQVVVIATGSSLAFYSVLTGECDKTIDNVYSGPITCVQFDPLGKYVLTTGEKHVRVFHNMTGYRVIISSTRANFRQSFNSAKKERMQEQIREAEDFLMSFGEETS